MTREPPRPRAVIIVVPLVFACVGLPPSPPQDAAGTETGTSSGDATTASTTLATSSGSIDADTSTQTTGGSTVGVTPDSSTGDATHGATSSSSTGDSGTTTGPELESSSGPPPPPPTCDEIFGTAAGYLLCAEDDVSCSFNVDNLGESCNIICGLFGQLCLGALDNPGDGTCFVQGNSTCDATGKGNTICICTK
jgi:hypothetical protein